MVDERLFEPATLGETAEDLRDSVREFFPRHHGSSDQLTGVAEYTREIDVISSEVLEASKRALDEADLLRIELTVHLSKN